ncbi:MAG: hypothetical protein ACREPQ_11990 [Rhodanobacter sp.]
MHTLKLSVSLPDASHPQVELRVSSNDSDCDVVIALPPRLQPETLMTAAPDTPVSPEDEYVLGGYAGI